MPPNAEKEFINCLEMSPNPCCPVQIAAQSRATEIATAPPNRRGLNFGAVICAICTVLLPASVSTSPREVGFTIKAVLIACLMDGNTGCAEV